ncbi:zinc-ribbon domain-containing protein [Ruegeria sp. HU-ET01832]|uniref:zinc-ribbon domain-containing protein n=1 Tax=Ruegeria sp. HU-ET01832 TaxID=3135906 RepID=UPI003103DBBC
MRLTCPNCSAQYEVPDEVIPAEGRDVQCSNCEKTWFQSKHPVADTAEVESKVEPETVPVAPPVDEPALAPAPQKPDVAAEQPAKSEDTQKSVHVDPDVASILKEEAAREADLRAKEAENLETQPDLGLDPPQAPDPEERIKELTRTEAAKDAAEVEPLPDVEAINSSLRSDEPVAKKNEVQPLPRSSGSGFKRGFVIAIVIGVVLLLLYANAQQISEAVPQADPVLGSYVSLVDQARLWLEAQTGSGS